MELVACPTPKEIVELLKGELAGDSATNLRKHLMSCSRCVEVVRKMAQGDDASGDSKKDSSSIDSKTVVSASPLHSKLGFLSPAEGPDELGRLAHYKVTRLLGEGGMGMVLQGEDTLLLRPVALKVIKPEFKDDESSQQRFLREARAMAQLKSDHVVMIHEVGSHNGMPFIAMELLEGAPLSDLLSEDEMLPIIEVLRLGREIAVALSVAHGHGVVHRDIKPENIWLEAPSGRVKLLDFGLARPHHVNTKLTTSGQIVGTPFYMSPEQARGGEVDERSDLFSLGCLLYEMLTGKPPFGRPTLMDTILALAVETPAEPSTLNPDCSSLIDAVILRLLAKSPGNRMESAQMLIAQLETIEKSLPANQEDKSLRKTVPGASGLWQRALDKKHSVAQGKPSAIASLRHSSTRKSERRQVTVLVAGCELFESDQYLENLDADNQSKILHAFEESCKQAVLKAEGTIVECTTESLIACFGYPLAQEDAAQLAVDAATNVLDALNKLSDEKNIQLGPWVAIHTGSAIVATENSVVHLAGDARNVATRMKNVATAGRIILSQSTHKVLKGNVGTKSLGHHQIKGIQDKIELFEVQSLSSSAGSLIISGQTELTPLTGRDQEISLLKDRWEQAQEGMGQVVLIIGEAGLGKSRLVHTMKGHVISTSAASIPQTARLTVHDPAVIEWRCSPHFRDTGLYPASNFFQRLLNFQRDEQPSAQFERLVRHLDRYGLATKEIVPVFASFLSLPEDERFPSRNLTPVREREELFQGLKDWLQAYSNEQPALFVVEDLHWLDASTLDFLGQLLAEGMHDRILILLTFRPDFRTPWPALAHQTSLALNRLTKRQVSELMKHKTSRDVSEAAVDEVYDRSGGVPLFVEEFTRMAQESGVLDQTPDADKQMKSLLSRAIPATLQDLIMARLDRMEGDRDLAQLASAIGREFSYELLAAVSGQDERTLSSELEKFVRAEILLQKGRPPQSTYVFKHALLEDALYNAMVKDQRQQCHSKIAEVLESRNSQSAQKQPEVIAHHFTEAGLTSKAIGYLHQAGVKSQHIFANVEAITHFKKGLELVETLPESEERDKSELALLVPLATAYQMVMGYAAPDVEPTLARARVLNQRCGYKEQLFAIMWVNFTWHLVNANLDLCLHLAEEMMALANEVNDKGMIMEAYVAPAVTLYYRGDFARCRTLCRKAVDEFEDLEQCRRWSAVLGQNSAVVHRCYLSLSLFHLGFADQALQCMNETLAIARRAGHPFSMAHALYFASWLYLNCRMGNELKETAQQELTLADDQGFLLWQATGTFHVGAALVEQGKLITGVENLEAGIKKFKAISASLTLPAQLAVLADGYIKTGQFEEAQQALDEGQSRIASTNNSVYAAEICRLRGVLSLSLLRDEPAAEKLFREAIQIARTCNTKAWELRATMSLSKLLQKQGKIDEARKELGPILATFQEGKSISDVKEAVTLMDSLK